MLMTSDFWFLAAVLAAAYLGTMLAHRGPTVTVIVNQDNLLEDDDEDEDDDGDGGGDRRAPWRSSLRSSDN